MLNNDPHAQAARDAARLAEIDGLTAEAVQADRHDDDDLWPDLRPCPKCGASRSLHSPSVDGSAESYAVCPTHGRMDLFTRPMGVLEAEGETDDTRPQR